MQLILFEVILNQWQLFGLIWFYDIINWHQTNEIINVRTGKMNRKKLVYHISNACDSRNCEHFGEMKSSLSVRYNYHFQWFLQYFSAKTKNDPQKSLFSLFISIYFTLKL